MASVSELVNRVVDITGLDDESGTSERVLALNFINDAYQQAVAESECLQASFTGALTSGTSDYDLISDFGLSDVLRIRYVYMTDTNGDRPVMIQMDEGKILDYRGLSTTVNQNTPTVYSFPAPNLIRLYPEPNSNVSINISYIKEPLALVEASPGAGEESTPTAFPKRFHYDVLANLAIAMAMEYDQRADEAGYYRTLANSGMDRLVAYVNEFGGVMPPRVRDYFRGRRYGLDNDRDILR